MYAIFLWTYYYLRRLYFVINLTAHVVLLPYGKYWSAARNIRDNEALANAAKISRTRIQVGWQYKLWEEGSAWLSDQVAQWYANAAQKSMIRAPLCSLDVILSVFIIRQGNIYYRPFLPFFLKMIPKILILHLTLISILFNV